MSTLTRFGLWQKALQTGLNRVDPESNRVETRGNAASNRVNRENRASSPSQPRMSHTHTRACVCESPDSHGATRALGLPGLPGLDQQFRGPLPGLKIALPGLPGSLPVSLHPVGDVALGPGDPGDKGLEWQGGVEDVPPARHAEPDWWRPRPLLQGSLVARLCAAGATVRSWSVGRGAMSEVEAPAGISTDLLHEVEARGWRIIPGGKANPEAKHDIWLAGVPIAELER